VTSRRLVRSIEELRGRRFARWIRESTEGQFDTFGPDSQREKQDLAAERLGVVDTGLVYQVAVSGKIAWRSTEMRRMLDDAAAGAFDVLLVGYSDRWQRNLRRTLEILEDELHPVGVAVFMADRRILSSDPEDWDELVAEATAAERYIRRLAGRITDGYAAKFRRYADQAGNPPLGFRRSAEAPHVLEIDPASIERAVEVFRRYAEGSLSMRDLARVTGLEYERVVKMLRNPLYAGWVRRHRGPDEERLPAPWRADPPVSDELWRRCADLRAQRLRGGGPSHRHDTDLLRGLVACGSCGRRIRSNGLMGEGARARRRMLHPDPCSGWGSSASVPLEAWEPAIEGQIAGTNLGPAAIARIRRVVEARVARPIDTTRARLERAIRDLALEHAGERLSDDVYLTGVRRLRAELEQARTPRRSEVGADEAIAAVADLAGLWIEATPEERARLVHAVYARIDVVGRSFAGVELTPWAYDIGLDQAMPELVGVDWRPRQAPGPHVHTVRVPIYGRRERLRIARSA
jgi:DNA invertase Pin-like site-specific DNA recombinase